MNATLDPQAKERRAERARAGVDLSPPVLLAPMAGITDLPFRRIVARFGAGLVVSEMVASREMVQSRDNGRSLARARAELGAGEGRTAVQLAGCEAHWLAEGARIAEAGGAPHIDINMGCPAKKVVGGMSGSALMRDPDHALRLIEAVMRAVSVPVSVKMRLGWDDASLNAADLARAAANAGVAMITVHGRTRCQFYKGHADWQAIGAVVRAAPVPVIANGDIVSVETARAAIAASDAAGVMIGRGAQGRPWLLAKVGAALFGTVPPTVPHGGDLVDLVAGHYESILSHYGRDLGVRVARKHLVWYAQAAGGCPQARRILVTLTDPRDVLAHLSAALASVSPPASNEAAA